MPALSLDVTVDAPDWIDVDKVRVFANDRGWIRRLTEAIQTGLTSGAVPCYTVMNDELVIARKHTIEVAQKTLDNEKVRLAAGVVNRVSVTRAELVLIQAEQRLREALEQISVAPIFSTGSGRPINALLTSDPLRTGAYPLVARPAGRWR